jgi:hypothetical protein
LWRELRDLVEIGDGAVVILLVFVGLTAVAQIHRGFRIEPDCLAVVGDGAVVILPGSVDVAAIVKSPVVIWNEPDRLVEIGDGAVVILLVFIGDTAIVIIVGDGAITTEQGDRIVARGLGAATRAKRDCAGKIGNRAVVVLFLAICEPAIII